MKKLTVLAIVFLLLPAFSAGAASTTHRKHVAAKGAGRANRPRRRRPRDAPADCA